MARIEYIKQRLENWARWHQQRDSGGLGYPSQSAFVRLLPRSSGGEAAIPVNDLDASETEDAVNSLRLVKSHLYLTLHHIYVQNWDIKRTAKVLCKAESTIKAHLDQADNALQAWFTAKQELRQKREQTAKKEFYDIDLLGTFQASCSERVTTNDLLQARPRCARVLGVFL